MDNLLILCTKLKTLKVREKELKGDISDVQKKIIDALNGKEKETCGQYTVTYKDIISHVIDTERLKKDFPDIAEQLTQEKTSKRLTVT